MNLNGLVSKLQTIINDGGMTSEAVSAAIEDLKKLGYEYNHDTFPKLVKTERFTDQSGKTPVNLAEALLWKLGKWKVYKQFAEQFVDEESEPPETAVVFFAFAKHLRNKENPIYDQHSIRAIWAICNSLTPDDRDKCRRLLMDRQGEWKDMGSGRTAVDCYEMFVRHIDEIVEAGANKREIDLLLMPLGQALKKCSKNYSEFAELCNWPVNG